MTKPRDPSGVVADRPVETDMGHVHACPTCYRDEVCMEICDIEPDLGTTLGGLPRRHHVTCSSCSPETVPPVPYAELLRCQLLRLTKARELACRLRDASPNSMHGWSDEECELLGELCGALGVEEDDDER